MKFSSAFFAKNLKNWRDFLNETQTEFAERFTTLGDSSAKRAIISSYETDSALPKLEFLFELSEKMGYTVDSICTVEIDFNAQTLREPNNAEKYLPTDPGIKELREKLDALWALNLHRAEKMEAWELEMKAMRAELEKTKAELEKLKSAK